MAVFTICTLVVKMQMLHSLGFKVFVGGNLGIPLSEAAIKCLKFGI